MFRLCLSSRGLKTGVVKYFPVSTVKQGLFPRHLKKCRTKKKKESTSVLTCDICKKSMLSVKSLNKHVYDNHGEFNCLECGEVFSSKRKFYLHKVKVHINSTFLCSQCGKSFSNNSNLIRHVKSIHQRRQDFICSLCGKRFYHSGDLTRHISIVHSTNYNCILIINF